MLRYLAVFALSVGLIAGVGYADETPTSAPSAEGSKKTLPPPSKVTDKSPIEVAEHAPKGTLRNPYTGQADKIAEGHKLFLSYSCSGCHGGNGGGGICPQLTHVVWIYGSSDDTLFRLIALGSDALKKQGYQRHGVTNVIGPMPPFGPLIKTDGQLWEIIAFVRSVYAGDPDRKNW